jgi:hypothetical protein
MGEGWRWGEGSHGLTYYVGDCLFLRLKYHLLRGADGILDLRANFIPLI